MRFIAFIVLLAAIPSYAGIIRQNVRHFSKFGSTGLIGDVTLSEGSGVTLTQVGQNVTITATSSGGLPNLTIKNKSANYTLLSGDDAVLCDASAGGFTITLPAATNTGKVYYIKKIDDTVNPITVTPNGSNTIDGSPSETLDIPNIDMPILDGGSNKWYVL